jgi:signal transduction histidine kinase
MEQKLEQLCEKAATSAGRPADLRPLVRVLVVEDDEDDFVLTRSLLEEIRAERFQIDWVRDYEEGVRRLSPGTHDVCLADYRLGERTGIELLREAVTRGCTIPIILLTGQGDLEIDMAAMAAGAADFLNKTEVTADQLERSIRYSIQQKKLEEQRVKLLEAQAARREAEAASRAKDQFLATLSHELRTPLTPVVMAANALVEAYDLPEKFRGDVETIRRNAELEAVLIDDLLDLTRIARGKVALHCDVVDLREKLQNVFDIVRCDAEGKRLTLSLEVAAAQPIVRADSARVQQILWNLLKNAIKFTPDGGSVRVRLDEEEEEGTQDDGRWMKDEQNASAASGSSFGLHPSSLTAPRSFVVVSVTDTGIGIDPAFLPNIFKPFQQGDSSVTQAYGGLGLGLSISKALVDLHHGKLTAHSRGRGTGATFTLRLLKAQQPATTTAPEPDGKAAARDGATAGAGAAAAPIGRRSILLVEDHADTSRLMARLLRGYGYDVRIANTQAAALQAAGEERFDCIISDIGLPDGSGLELMRQIKGRHGVKGIALSGYGMEDDVRKSRDAGFDEHLTKPVNLDRLRATLADVLRGK